MSQHRRSQFEPTFNVSLENAGFKYQTEEI